MLDKRKLLAEIDEQPTLADTVATIRQAKHFMAKPAVNMDRGCFQGLSRAVLFKRELFRLPLMDPG